MDDPSLELTALFPQLESLKGRAAELEQALERLRWVHDLLQQVDRAWATESPIAHALRAVQRAFEADVILFVQLDSQGRPARWWQAGWETISADDPRAPFQILLDASWATQGGTPRILSLSEAMLPAGQLLARSALMVPLRDPWGNEGLLALFRQSPEGFPEEACDLAGAAAEPLAVRLYSLHALEQQRHLNRAVTLLFRVARIMASSPELPVTLPQVVRIIREETGWPQVAILAHEPATQRLCVMAWEGYSATADLGRCHIPVDQGITGRAFRTGEPQRVPDVSLDPDYVVGDPATRSELAVPIFAGEMPWGVLDAQSPERYAFTPDDETLMLAVAGTISIGLEAARVYERVQKERAQVGLERDRLIALYEGYLALQQHADPVQALTEAVKIFPRLGWRAARCRVLDEFGKPPVMAESVPPPSFPPLDLEPWLRNDPRLERYRWRGRFYRLPTDDPEIRAGFQNGGKAPIPRVALPLPDATGRLLGLVELETPDEREDLEGSLLRPTELLTTLLAISFDRGRLLRRYEQRLREQTMLYRAVSALLRSDEPGPILTEITAALCEALDGTSAYFVAVDPGRRTAWVAAEYYAETANPMERISDLGVIYYEEEVPLEWMAIRERQIQTLYADDPPDAYEEERAILRRYGGWSVLIIPIFAQEEPLGVVEVWDSRRRREFDAGERALAQAIAQHAAIALQRARLYEQLQQVNRRLEAIFFTVEDGLILLDRNGRIVQINAAAQRLMAGAALSPERSLADLLRQLRHRSSEAARTMTRWIRRIRREAASGFRMELSLPLKDSTHWFALICTPVQDKDPLGGGWLLVLRDITAERERDRLQEEMIRMLMHDLQNPLGPIHLALEELATYSELSPSARSLIRTALRGLGRLQNLISNLLDLARLESGRLPIEQEPVDLGGLVEEAVEEWDPVFQRQRLRVTVEVAPKLPQVWLDRQLISRVLWNLLSNATKFAPTGGEIRIRAYPQGEMVVLEVFNSGSYIPPDQRQRIFERFAALPGRGGYGLGLAFSKLAVEAHRGRIEVESDASGTTFVIRVPIRPSPLV
ncbi:GAF domain-containing protein [Thermoflexus sp.]|uniref:GAF domain-containing protein n=1 Tax=Thermoflexus sp. TaxID=1969742 RepID=UPI0025FB8C10|nr:GAF domain-containing protein [Thermoflexus sp.]MCS7350091.1 GAF domain-containing protein [Thermoflexus sp.]MCX7689455.1 GAF domain-containing protein [Thermoflexus sp.]MDW8179540.1 GAF domain-containing protein [Anaerolineae bacterium]